MPLLRMSKKNNRKKKNGAETLTDAATAHE